MNLEKYINTVKKVNKFKNLEKADISELQFEVAITKILEAVSNKSITVTQLKKKIKGEK